MLKLRHRINKCIFLITLFFWLIFNNVGYCQEVRNYKYTIDSLITNYFSIMYRKNNCKIYIKEDSLNYISKYAFNCSNVKKINDLHEIPKYRNCYYIVLKNINVIPNDTNGGKRYDLTYEAMRKNKLNYNIWILDGYWKFIILVDNSKIIVYKDGGFVPEQLYQANW